MNETTRGKPATAEAEPSRTPAGEGDDALRALRAAIDRVDGEILGAPERARAPRRAGRRAQAQRRRRHLPGRARARPRRRRSRPSNPGPFPTAAIRPVFREIISGTRRLEARLRVAYLGPEGTFSHLAARETFGSQAEFLPQATIADVFAAVERGEADHGVVPVENTTEGVVTQTLDTLVGLGAPDLRRDRAADRALPALAERPARGRAARRVAPAAARPVPRLARPATCRAPSASSMASTVAAGALAAREPDVAAIGSRLAAELLGLRRSRRRTSRTAATTRRASWCSAAPRRRRRAATTSPRSSSPCARPRPARCTGCSSPSRATA